MPVILRLAFCLFALSMAPPHRAQGFATATWMEDLAPQIGSRRFIDIVIPGTHDSGTAAITPTSAFAPDQPGLQAFDGPGPVSLWVRSIAAGWGKTQGRSIAEQLEDGIRYLDLRVCRHAVTGQLLICHGQYSYPMAQVIQEIGSHLVQHEREIVVLDLSAFYGLTAADHQQLASALQAALGSRLVPSTQWSLSSVTCDELWARDQQVFLIYHDASVVAQFPGFWTGSDRRSVWPNAQALGDLESFLDDEVASQKPADRIWIVQGVLTPNEVVIARGLLLPTLFAADMRSWSRWTTLAVTRWVENDWANAGLNIVIVDYPESWPFATTLIARNLP